MPDSGTRIFVAGHRGLVGSGIVRRLSREGNVEILTASRAELDLRDQPAVDSYFSVKKPDYVILAAAKVGGIMANSTQPAEFLYDNLAIQTNVIHSAWVHKARKVVFLGSSCIYPKMAPQPISEDSLLTGPLEPTNEAYAIAKIAGLKMLQFYRSQYGFDGISLMPTNLYGPGDNFNLQTSHVLPALMRRFHEAKIQGAGEVFLWGTGTPRREFLHVDDLADAVYFAMEHYDRPEPMNIGVGDDISIADVAAIMARIVGYKGAIRYDSTKPDGTPRKLLNVSKLNGLGWKAKIALEEGLTSTYQWFLQNVA
jgi:GDP-L-fucose synthase